MTSAITCPACGAGNAPDAEWCNQCFTAFATEGAAQPETAAPDTTADAPSSPPGWTCAMCDHQNPVEVSICERCESPIFASFGRAEINPMQPEAAVGRALIVPGWGHAALGLGAVGFLVGFLVLATLLAGLALGIGGVGVGWALVVVALAVWGVSVIDVTRLRSGEAQPLLRPRVMTVLGGLVMAVLFGAIFTQI